MAKVRTNKGECSERLIQRLQGEIRYLKKVLGMRMERREERTIKDGDKSNRMHAFSTEISPENTSHLLNSEYDDKEHRKSLNQTDPIIDTKTQTRVSSGFKKLSQNKDLMLEIPHSERNIPISNHLSIKNSPVGSDGPTFGNVNM